MFDTSNIKLITIENKTVARMFIGSGSSSKEVALTCKVTYNGNGNTSGSVPSPTEGRYSETVTLATNSGSLAKTGYLFDGWNTAADGSGTTYSAGSSYTLNGNITLYAKWAEAVTITFDNNISYSGTQYFVSGQTFSITGTATPGGALHNYTIKKGTSLSSSQLSQSFGVQGYNLSGLHYETYSSGWYTDRACTQAVSTSNTFSQNTTIYTKWFQRIKISVGDGTFTIPKFAGSVYFYCRTKGGGRVAHSETASSSKCHSVICGPGWGRGEVSKTFTGVAGKSLTLTTYKCTVGTEYAETSQPGDNGYWDVDKSPASDIIGSSWNGRSISAGSRTYSSGNYKVVYSWGAGGGNVYGNYYWANASKGSFVVFTASVSTVGGDNNERDVLNTYNPSPRTNWTTFTSPYTDGAAGAFGFATSHSSSVAKVSISAAGGGGSYSRTCEINP